MTAYGRKRKSKNKPKELSDKERLFMNVDQFAVKTIICN
jgi:hypothetical protein